LFQGQNATKTIAVAVGIIVLIAGYIVSQSLASGFFAAAETEGGTLSGNAQVISDNSASGGKAIQFSAPTPPPPPPPPPSATTCPLPAYPGANCTGVPTGVALTAYTGSTTISTPNTVIDSKNITSCLNITAPGVIIRKSKVSCTNSNVINAGDGAFVGTPLLIEDTEITCLGTSGTGIGDTNFTASRVNIHDCENGFDIDQLVTIQDSYIHNLFNSAESHTDGAQFAGGHYRISNGQYVKSGSSFVVDPNARDITIVHNTIYTYNTIDHQDGTSAIISNHGSDTNVLIQDNLMAGGAYTLYCDQGSTGINYRVVNNHFSTAFHPTVGAYGPVEDCADEVHSGNVYHESGQPVPF
jgi:hypothetical protein